MNWFCYICNPLKLLLYGWNSFKLCLEKTMNYISSLYWTIIKWLLMDDTNIKSVSLTFSKWQHIWLGLEVTTWKACMFWSVKCYYLQDGNSTDEQCAAANCANSRTACEPKIWLLLILKKNGISLWLALYRYGLIGPFTL